MECGYCVDPGARSSLDITSIPADVRRVALCLEEEIEAQESSVITWGLGPKI